MLQISIVCCHKLIVIGNPGVAQYYEEYMETFDESCNSRIPMCCISHAGHGLIPKDITYTGWL